jgi:hypothetical protein
MTFEEFEQFKSGRKADSDFGTRVQVEYWPRIEFAQYIEPTGPTCMGRKSLVTVFAAEGHPPEVEDDEFLDEVRLSTEELYALPSWEAFRADLFGALEFKADAQAAKRAAEEAANQPPPAPDA